MPRTSRTLFGMWAATIEAQSAMWTTLAIRVPLLMTGTMTAAEQTRMVSEKFEALTESARDTATSVGQMMLNPAAVMQSPVAMMGAVMTLSSAAVGPYHSRVNSNARRLRTRKA